MFGQDISYLLALNLNIFKARFYFGDNNLSLYYVSQFTDPQKIES